MKVRLKRDIIIPAGTVFDDAPRRLEMVVGHVEHIVALTDDSSGTLLYYRRRRKTSAFMPGI